MITRSKDYNKLFCVPIVKSTNNKCVVCHLCYECFFFENPFKFCVMHRTPGTGLYDNLQQYNLTSATDIFDITFFPHNPKPFFTLAKELYPGKYQPNIVHWFIRLLEQKGVLLRNYTQNIDGLERSMFIVKVCVTKFETKIVFQFI